MADFEVGWSWHWLWPTYRIKTYQQVAQASHPACPPYMQLLHVAAFQIPSRGWGTYAVRLTVPDAGPVGGLPPPNGIPMQGTHQKGRTAGFCLFVYNNFAAS
jgi:hypothetical protein